MARISLHNVSIAFGGGALLDDVSLDIHKGQRICFLGRNGVGKSTLMKIIAGEIVPDSGTVIKDPGLRIAYLPQDVPGDLSGNVFDIVVAGAQKAGSQLARWHQLTAAHQVTDELHELQHFLDTHDGWHIQTVVKRVLMQVQLDGDLDFGALSGGMRRRVMLARALVNEPEVLLLDEPTNHLDIQSIAWLESFILGSRLTIAFITHDRKLLKRLATRIVELDRGNLYDWSCDYETFLSRKEAALDAEEREWDRFDKKLAQEEVWIRRGIKARRTRNEGRVRALKKMREERRKRRERSGSVAMAISQSERSGDLVIRADHASFSYDDKPIIRDLTISIQRHDRIGILGPNGCGKTTLVKLLMGKLQPQSGAIETGTNLHPVYFDQLREVLSPEKTVWENVAPGGGDRVFIDGEPRHVISYLQDFLFTADRAKSPVKQLSGGERNRLMLARLFTQESNVLVLDEPTNDLDTETLELLEELLANYQGTVLTVSHDREFLNNVVTSTLVFEQDGSVKEYVGGYDDWERQKTVSFITEHKSPAQAPKSREQQKANTTPHSGHLSNKEKRLLDSLPSVIESLDREGGELNAKMANPEYFQKPGFIAEARGRLKEIESKLAESYRLWEELESRMS